jgi:hypothetical protein
MRREAHLAAPRRWHGRTDLHVAATSVCQVSKRFRGGTVNAKAVRERC